MVEVMRSCTLGDHAGDSAQGEEGKRALLEKTS
jgi:hypothetical protein